MNKIISIFLTHCIFCGPILAQPSAAELLNKAIEAMGGKVKYSQIENYTAVTRTTATGALTKLKMTVTETNQPPDRSKQLFEIDKGFRVLCLAGNQSWQQVGSDVSDLSLLQKREMERAFFRDTIHFFKHHDEVGTSVKYVGEQVLASKTFHILEVKNLSSDTFSLYVDAETFLIAKKSYHGAAESGFALFEESYSDYRSVAGLMVPHRIVVKTNGKVFIESELTQFEINKELPEDFFYKK